MTAPLTLEDAGAQLKQWIWRGKFASTEAFQIDFNTAPASAGSHYARLSFKTARNSYAIVGKPAHPLRPPGSDMGYLGCVVSAREPRSGETWTRGSDLADGPFTEETWNRIVQDILSYELATGMEVTEESTVG